MNRTLKTLSADPVQSADWLIRLAVVIHAAGLAVALFSGAGSGIGGVALMEWGIPHDPIFLTEKIASLVLLALALSLWIYPFAPAMVLISLAIIAECLAVRRFGGEYFSEYTLFTHAPRFLMPIALLFLVRFRRSGKEAVQGLVSAMWVLRLAICVVFFVHGVEAVLHNPRFIDLIIGSMYRVFDMSVSEATATTALTVIGVVDILVALVVLVRPGRKLLFWMCFWGFITALSRPLSMGFASYPDVFVRAAHFLAPVSLWLLVRYARARAEKEKDSSRSPLLI